MIKEDLKKLSKKESKKLVKEELKKLSTEDLRRRIARFLINIHKLQNDVNYYEMHRKLKKLKL